MTHPRYITTKSGLQPIFNLIALSYYRWALKEICPLHPDVPCIVRRVAELEGVR